MIAALALVAAAALPAGTARYRVELSGVHVGVAELAVRCGGARCGAEWRSRLVLPEAAGGAVRARRVRAALDGAGRLAGELRVEEDGRAAPAHGARGIVPASFAELALAAALGRGGEPGAPARPSTPPRPRRGDAQGERCLEVLDERTGARGRACARHAGAGLRVDALGVSREVALAPDGLPALVEVPAQGARYVRDAGAALPARPPALEVRVAGPADAARARSFCGRAADPPPPPAPEGLPAPEAEGESCRAKARALVLRARAAGLPARVAVGVAHDGRGFAWHAWAEVRADGTWIPIDPSFGELPARGPRFTLGRYAPGDRAAEDQAGRAILACWGRARVEE